METYSVVDAREHSFKEFAETLLSVSISNGADFVYPRTVDTSNPDNPACAYVKNGEPSCIVGQVFARLGVPVPILTVWDCGDGINGGSIGSLIDGDRVLVSDDRIRTMLMTAQTLQDSGTKWVQAAHEAVTRVL